MQVGPEKQYPDTEDPRNEKPPPHNKEAARGRGVPRAALYGASSTRSRGVKDVSLLSVYQLFGGRKYHVGETSSSVAFGKPPRMNTIPVPHSIVGFTGVPGALSSYQFVPLYW